jgi:hypothetical protein
VDSTDVTLWTPNRVKAHLEDVQVYHPKLDTVVTTVMPLRSRARPIGKDGPELHVTTWLVVGRHNDLD